MSYKILLVDDDPKVLQGLKHILQKEKYEIHCALSVREALEILARVNFDIVISDEQMPGVVGSILLSKMSQEYPNTIRILLTGQATLEGTVRAVNEGKIYRFLQKPSNGLDLVITLRRALQHKELIEKSWRLLKLVRQQSDLLDDFINRYPDLEKQEPNKSYSIYETEGDYDSLIKKIDAELRKTEKLFPVDSNILSDKPDSSSSSSSSSSSDINSKESRPEEPTSIQSSKSLDHSVAKEILDETDMNLKDMKPIMTRSEIYDLLDNCAELKAMSPTVAQILKMTQSERCSIDQVVKVVKQDHAVSLKILKLANSSAYTRGEPVDTVQKAVMRIGLVQIRQAVLNINVIDRFSTESQYEQIKISSFWEHSIATGLIAAEITRFLNETEAQIDAAFTMGLLHDVGRLVYLEMLGDKYGQLLELAGKHHIPLEQVESRILLVNHADAMDRILHKWNFSKDLLNPIALHQLSLGNIRRLAPRFLNEVAVLALANRLAHALLLGCSGNPTLYPTEDFAHTLRLNPDLFHRIESYIPEQTTDIKFTMLANSTQTAWPQLADEIRNQLPIPFRPLYLSAEPEFDSLRIFCNVLATWEESELPNVGIIQIKRGTEKVSLTAEYKKAESKAGVDNLPLIILSPKGDIMLEDSFMAKRHYALLPFPLTINQFGQALKEKVFSLSEISR